jgi:hypothetical protein
MSMAPSFFVSTSEQPNAAPQLLPQVGATEERTLEAVRCQPLFGTA